MTIEVYYYSEISKTICIIIAMFRLFMLKLCSYTTHTQRLFALKFQMMSIIVKTLFKAPLFRILIHKTISPNNSGTCKTDPKNTNVLFLGS